ncbi:hypothetical protein EVAR_6312_1 [Eumeta japonica]|uniref:Uncharacterized protein n=1 Tax=Eumeta variegata TaxID=151549 RepID=A0A4C1T8C0_EUMVA|nr:hypothetical protein EVAR_6312_1 [Eumeta japonica]
MASDNVYTTALLANRSPPVLTSFDLSTHAAANTVNLKRPSCYSCDVKITSGREGCPPRTRDCHISRDDVDRVVLTLQNRSAGGTRVQFAG